MVYLFLAEGFEEIEALTPVDLLRRVGVEVTTVGIGGREITGAHGIKVTADITDTEADARLASGEGFEMIVLPGGMPGTLNLDASTTVDAFIKAADASSDAYIAAICAAPTILAKRGILDGKMATCYPGMEDQLTGAEVYASDVILDSGFITARGMGVATEFALQLVECLKGESTAESLRDAIVA